jgi:hypothetical protein
MHSQLINIKLCGVVWYNEQSVGKEPFEISLASTLLKLYSRTRYNIPSACVFDTNDLEARVPPRHVLKALPFCCHRVGSHGRVSCATGRL